jgi:hypothetical protein
LDAEFAEGCPRVQIALNIADVAPAAGQPVRRMAARRTRHHLLLWPASLRWTRRLVMEGPQVAGSSVRTAVLDNLWLADLTQMQATYAQCPEGRPGWFPKCLLIQGRCPAEYLALLPSHGSCNYECKVASSARWICNRIRKWALSVRTCIRACTVVVQKRYHGCRCTGCCVPPWRRTLPIQG